MSLAESFGRTGLARFINTTAGRVARIVVGIGLIGCGFTIGEGAGKVLLILVGLIPLSAGAFNLCLISALLGGPIRGDRVGRG